MNKVDFIRNKVKDLDYGFYDSLTDSMMTIEKENNNDYLNEYARIQTPEQVNKNKFGVCWDQSLYVAYLAKLCNLPYHYVFVDLSNKSTHTFVIVEENNKFHHIESADSKYKGIHTFDSIEECFEEYSYNLLVNRGTDFLRKDTDRFVEHLWFDTSLTIPKYLSYFESILVS